MTRTRLHLWSWLIAGSCFLSMGCTPASLGFILMGLFPDEQPPLYKLADKEKEITVAVVSHFGDAQFQDELKDADYELGQFLVAHLTKKCAENKEKVKFIPGSRVKSYQTKPITDSSSLQELGKRLGADKVIQLELGPMSLYAPNCRPAMYQGKVILDVRVVEVEPKSGEPVAFKQIYTTTHPADVMEDSSDKSVKQFRAEFNRRAAGDIARWFTAYPPIKRSDMREFR